MQFRMIQRDEYDISGSMLLSPCIPDVAEHAGQHTRVGALRTSLTGSDLTRIAHGLRRPFLLFSIIHCLPGESTFCASCSPKTSPCLGVRATAAPTQAHQLTMHCPEQVPVLAPGSGVRFSDKAAVVVLAEQYL